MSGQLLNVNLSQIDDVAQHALGSLHITQAGNHYRYMQADGSVTAYNFYTYIPGTWQIAEPMDVGVDPADAESVPVCVWDGSSTAITDNYYAWVFVGPGTFTATTAAAVAAQAIIYGHATAGLVDDAATALLLKGVHAPTAIGSATTGTFYAAIPMYAEDLP